MWRILPDTRIAEDANTPVLLTSKVAGISVSVGGQGIVCATTGDSAKLFLVVFNDSNFAGVVDQAGEQHAAVPLRFHYSVPC
jgi:hypothetical protein